MCVCHVHLWGYKKVEVHLCDGKNMPPATVFECPKHGKRVIWRVINPGRTS